MELIEEKDKPSSIIESIGGFEEKDEVGWGIDPTEEIDVIAGYKCFGLRDFIVNFAHKCGFADPPCSPY